MINMDYREYVAHGTGWGALVASNLAALYPENCAALHLGSPTPQLFPSTLLGNLSHSVLWKLRKVFFSDSDTKMMDKFDFDEYQKLFHPSHSLAVGFMDSPFAVALFVYSRLLSTTDSRGNIENTFTKDELLTQISLFWFTRSLASSIWMFSISTRILNSSQPHPPLTVPLYVSVYPHQLVLPKYFSDKLYKQLQYWVIERSGGYFPAWETPEELSQTLQVYFAQFSTKSMRQPSLQHSGIFKED